MTWEDFLQDLRTVLIVRSQSVGSRWNPLRARWTTWVVMVCKSQTINLHNQSKALKRIPEDLKDSDDKLLRHADPHSDFSIFLEE